MPVPFAALTPLVIITAMFGVTSGVLTLSQTYRNEGKPPRHSQDLWDTRMQDRDERISGSRRGQTQNPVAPPSFATNSGLMFEKPLNRIFM